MKLLTLDEVAERLGIAPISVRRLVRTGQLLAVRPLGGRGIRISERDLDRFIAELRKQAVEAAAR